MKTKFVFFTLMLLQAFAEDVIDTIKDEYLREKLDKKLIEILMSTR